MKVIEQSVRFITPIDGNVVLKRIEECGRVCYKSERKIEEGSAEKFCKAIIKRGHEAVLEHAAFTVKFITDRSVTHEIVRHRMASYCQESQRYCNYSKEQFNGEITFIKPVYIDEGTFGYRMWLRACESAETAYFDLLNEGFSPEQARVVLPNCTKTEIVMTANIREWRHFFKLRTSPAAHPQIRELVIPLLKEVQRQIPVLFDDIEME